MDSGQAPVSTRLHIFNTFITSKWAWASPVMLPDRVAIRKLESMKHTMLLSLFRIPTDTLLSWIDNVASRRRAVKLICQEHGGPQLGRTWLSRQWSSVGHLARTTQLQPMRRILSACGGGRVGPVVRPSWVADILVRRGGPGRVIYLIGKSSRRTGFSGLITAPGGPDTGCRPPWRPALTS